MFLMLVLKREFVSGAGNATGPAATGDRADGNKLPLIRWRKPLPFPPERACNWRWQTRFGQALPRHRRYGTSGYDFPRDGRQGFGDTAWEVMSREASSRWGSEAQHASTDCRSSSGKLFFANGV